MSQFQTLIRSRGSPLNIQTLTLVLFTDAIMLMPDLPNGYNHSCEIAKYGKAFISIFQQCFASINKIFILRGGLGTRL